MIISQKIFSLLEQRGMSQKNFQQERKYRRAQLVIGKEKRQIHLQIKL